MENTIFEQVLVDLKLQLRHYANVLVLCHNQHSEPGNFSFLDFCFPWFSFIITPLIALG